MVGSEEVRTSKEKYLTKGFVERYKEMPKC